MGNPTKTNNNPEQSWLMGFATAVVVAAVLLLGATAAGFVLWAMFR